MEDFKNRLWVEKYRPASVSECILPASIKETFQQFVDAKFVPNLLLVGKGGVGKTSVAKAIMHQLDADSLFINGSLNGGVDTLRTEIQQFAATVSLNGGRKYVIIDEGDHLTQSTQAALRSFMETYADNCGFIVTANYPTRIIEPLHGRFSLIEFTISKDERSELLSQFLKRILRILNVENVPADQRVVASLIMKYFPDFRRTINELQKYSASGSIDSGILTADGDADWESLFKSVQDKKFSDVRKWVASHADVEPHTVFRQLYDKMSTQLTTSTIPILILLLAKYQFQSASVADQEINTVACLAEIMGEVEWK